MKERSLRVSYSSKNHKFPAIFLQGKWLLNANFNLYDQVRVIVEKEKLIIEKIKEDQVRVDLSKKTLPTNFNLKINERIENSEDYTSTDKT